MLQEIWDETGTKPTALATRPELVRRWKVPYEVWVELSGSRNYTMGGAAEIPFSEFFMWATAHDYTHLEMQYMWEDMHIVDKCWLDQQASRQKEITENQKNQAEAKKTAAKGVSRQ